MKINGYCKQNNVTRITITDYHLTFILYKTLTKQETNNCTKSANKKLYKISKQITVQKLSTFNNDVDLLFNISLETIFLD